MSGSATNKASDGSTSQKTLVDSSLTLSMSLVSMYNQNSASTEIKGTEARTAPANELRFAISEMATTKTAVIVIFIRYCIR